MRAPYIKAVNLSLSAQMQNRFNGFGGRCGKSLYSYFDDIVPSIQHGQKPVGQNDGPAPAIRIVLNGELNGFAVYGNIFGAMTVFIYCIKERHGMAHKIH